MTPETIAKARMPRMTRGFDCAMAILLCCLLLGLWWLLKNLPPGIAR